MAAIQPLPRICLPCWRVENTAGRCPHCRRLLTPAATAQNGARS